VGLSSLTIFQNGLALAAGNVSPLSTSWNTAAVANGSYILSAKAYDVAGNPGVSSNVTVTVNNAIPAAPTASLTYPASGSTVSGIVTVTANASASAGVSRVAFYVNNVPQAADTIAPYSFNWDTTTVANGSYTLTAKATDTAGTVGSSSNVTVTVNNNKTAPTVSLTSPSGASTVSGTVAVTTSTSTGVSRVEFYVNSVLQTTSTSSPYTYSWNTAALASGSYTLSAKAYDAAGSAGTSSNVTVTVSNDKTAPTVSLTSPASGSTVSGTVAVTASASDNVGVSRVEFYVNNVLQTTSTSSPYTFSWNTTSLINGSYTLSAKAYDAAGNVGTSSNVSVTSNNAVIAPTVSVTSPSSGSTVSGTVTVTASASANTGVSKVEFYVNSVLQATDTSSPYSFSWNTAALANGSCILSAKAYDAAGNAGTSTNVTVTVNNDKTVPTVSLTAPTSGATVSGTVAVTASASDNVGVSKVEFYVNSILQTTVTGALYTFNWNTTAVANGSYTLTAKAYDAAGNVATSSNVTVTVNNINTAPTVSVTSPTSGATVSGTVVVTANASANAGITRVAFYVNNVAQAADTIAPYTYSWNTTTVANGSYALVAKVTDTAGTVVASSSVTVTVSN
jgi:hypothetical protein